jgi:transposase-like protein
MGKRCTDSPEFKARVAMEAISCRKTFQEIAADHAIHPIQVSQWKRQLLDCASELFTRGKKSKDNEDGQAKEAELFQQIGKLQMELERLKKSLSCSDAHELPKLVDQDHPEISISNQCALLGLPRSTLSYPPSAVRESTLWIMARIDALYLEDPCSDSRRMVDDLARDGIPINRERVRKPHATHGFTGYLPETAHHCFRISLRAVSLPGGPQTGHQGGSALGDRHHRHPAVERFSLPGGDCGSVLQERAQLVALEQP